MLRELPYFGCCTSWAIILLCCSAVASAQIQVPAQVPIEEPIAVLARQLVAAPGADARDAILSAQPAALSRQLVIALNQLGDVPLLKRDAPHARELYAIACEVAHRISDPRAGFECRFHQANASIADARYDESMATFRDLLAEAAAARNHADMARALHGIGMVHRSRSQHAEAQASYDQALREAIEAGDGEQEEEIEMHVGLLYTFLGKYRDSTNHLERSLQIARSLHQNRDTINDLIALGGLWYHEKDYALAVQHENEALALIQKTGITDNLHTVYQHLAIENAALKKIDLAIRYHELTVETTSEQDLYGRMMALYNYGANLSQWGRNDLSIEKLRAGLALAEKIERREMIPHFRVTLAETALGGRHWQEAEAFSRSAIEAAQGFAEPFLVIRAYDAWGVSLHRLGRDAEAEAALKASIDGIRRLREEVPAAPETLAAFMRDKISVYFHLAQTLLAEGRTAEALAVSEQAKSRVLLEVLAGGQVKVSKALTADETRKEGALWKQVTDWNQQVMDESRKAKPDGQRLKILNASTENARLSFRDFESTLYAQHEQLKLHRLEIEPVAPADLLANFRGRDTALLEYMADDEGVLLFVVTPEATRVYHLSTGLKQLSADVAAFRDQLASRDIHYPALAQSLYRSLLAPAAAQLAGKHALIIVPDGPLWKLPFQALETGAGKFLVEEQVLSFAPSLTVLHEILGMRRNSAKAANSRALIVSPLDLAGADTEAAGLVAIYGAEGSKVYAGSDAVAARIREDAPHYSVLHLASHAVFQDRSPMLSYLTLAKGSLDAREMMDLNLHADLVVLSACETGRGETVNGEGLLGMSWALFVAGSQATVASQWQVDSLSTAGLMLGFHRAMHAGTAKAEALRNAELSVMRTKDYHHPFYWAAFELIGNGF